MPDQVYYRTLSKSRFTKNEKSLRKGKDAWNLGNQYDCKKTRCPLIVVPLQIQPSNWMVKESNMKNVQVGRWASEFGSKFCPTDFTGETWWNTHLIDGFNPSEKYESQLGWLFPYMGVSDHYPYEKWLFHWEYTLFSDQPICGKIKNVPNHQPAILIHCSCEKSPHVETNTCGPMSLVQNKGEPPLVKIGGTIKAIFAVYPPHFFRQAHLRIWVIKTLVSRVFTSK